MHIKSAKMCLHLVFMTEALTQGGPGQSQVYTLTLHPWSVMLFHLDKA